MPNKPMNPGSQSYAPSALRFWLPVMGGVMCLQFTTLKMYAVERKFEAPSKGITVAKIGHLLIIGGTEDTLAPLRQIRATFIVDSLDEYYSHLKGNSATILQPPVATPTGRNMIARGQDGIVFEYVELKNK